MGLPAIDVAAGAFVQMQQAIAIRQHRSLIGLMMVLYLLMEISAANTEGVMAQGTTSNDPALTITFTSSEETEDFRS